MTFSIVARGGAGAQAAYGVAVASKFLAVGSIVPAAAPGLGAVATQSFAKWSYRADVLDLLAQGASATEAVARVTAADPQRETRQLGVVGAGDAATHTGIDCLEWAGGVSGGDAVTGHYAIQGNLLTGPDVVAAMEDAWLAGTGLALPRRLLAALMAGDAVGGDRRGRQGAALYVVQAGAGYDGSGVLVDLRVDDDPEASARLDRLLELNELVYGAPEGVRPLAGALAQEVRARLGRLGHRHPDLSAALEHWAGIENLEMRLSREGIDARVLDHLRRQTD